MSAEPIEEREETVPALYQRTVAIGWKQPTETRGLCAREILRGNDEYPVAYSALRNLRKYVVFQAEWNRVDTPLCLWHGGVFVSRHSE